MLKRFGFQFFAEGGDNQQNNLTQSAQQSTQSTQQSSEKTYTQEQLSSLMANEKRTARQAILKELGFEFKDDQSYSKTIQDIKKVLDQGKTEQQLDKEAKTKAESERDSATQRAELAEMKVSALSAGVKPTQLDDMITLAKAKMANGKTAEQAFEDLKKIYPAAFGLESSSGTGTGNNPAKKQTSSESLGKRLASVNKHTTKSSYFKN